jgi:LSD1 subclass zinc finger protein
MTIKIELKCHSCDVTLHIPVTAAGKKIRCPKCQSVVSVPKQQDEAPKDFARENHDARLLPLQSPEWTRKMLSGKQQLRGKCPKCSKRLILSTEEVLEKKIDGCPYCQIEFLIPVSAREKVISDGERAAIGSSTPVETDGEEDGPHVVDNLQDEHSSKGVGRSVNVDKDGSHTDYDNWWDHGPNVQESIETFGSAVNDIRNTFSLKLKNEVPEDIRELFSRNEAILYVGRSSETLHRFWNFVAPLFIFFVSLLGSISIAVSASGTEKLWSLLFFGIFAVSLPLLLRWLSFVHWKNTIYIVRDTAPSFLSRLDFVT